MNSYNLITILFISTILLLGCKNDDKNSTITPTINSHLNIDEVKDFLPSAYKNGSILVYKNENNEEWLLSTNYFEAIEERQFEGVMYKNDAFQASIFDSEDHSFQISISGQANYSKPYEVVKSISFDLMPLNPTGTVGVFVRFTDGQPIVNTFSNFHEKLTLNNKVFDAVYVGNSRLNGFEKYSEIYVNKNEGVVAFRDKNNDLWVFDRINN